MYLSGILEETVSWHLKEYEKDAVAQSAEELCFIFSPGTGGGGQNLGISDSIAEPGEALLVCHQKFSSS